MDVDVKQQRSILKNAIHANRKRARTVSPSCHRGPKTVRFSECAVVIATEDENEHGNLLTPLRDSEEKKTEEEDEKKPVDHDWDEMLEQVQAM
ncbi:hypothetical protein L596_019657 [Steinernema carpocapsae]|nr:hypothetical protein L596_019657 [Steinernema carpocapsae]